MNCKDFMEELENYQKEHPIRCFFNRLWHLIEEIPSEVKNTYQRLIRGYADVDVYSLNYYILNKIYKPFIAFVRYEEEHGHSLPTDFASDPAAWLVVLSKIEYALTDAYKLENDPEYKSLEGDALKEHHKKVQEGFELLGKYMMDLWD
jgi:hypothetical protein